MVLYILACFVLILFVLLQPGKSDAAAVFGGGTNSAAFGSRGTATVLAKITITAAIVFFLIAFVFSIPGIFEKRSIGEGVNAPAEQAPAPVIPMALRGLWGSFFSRSSRGRAMRRLRGLFSKIALVAGPPLAPELATPELLQEKVSSLRGDWR